MNMKFLLKVFAIFSLILFTQSTETVETVRLLEDNQVSVPSENKEISEPDKRELSEVQTENNNQESPAEGNVETQAAKDGEGRFLACSKNGSACWTHAQCCSGYCLIYCDTLRK